MQKLAISKVPGDPQGVKVLGGKQRSKEGDDEVAGEGKGGGTDVEAADGDGR